MKEADRGVSPRSKTVAEAVADGLTLDALEAAISLAKTSGAVVGSLHTCASQT
jgi:hypothetical protein